MNKNKKLAAAFTLIVTAAATMVGAYALGNFTTNDSSGYVDLSEVDENKTAKATDEEQDSQMQTAKAEEKESEFGLDNIMDATDEYIEEDVSTAEKKSDASTQVAEATETADNTQTAEATESVHGTEVATNTTENQTTEENHQEAEISKTAGDETAQVMSSSAVNETASTNLSFSAEEKLLWPVEGNVIMNYSMDKTVYFATLDQYKYNPALIIGCEAGNSVKAAADGKVVSIENLDETGTTMTVDLGDGYQAIYGQLKDVTLKAGDTCKAGDVLGSVNEPSRYYLKEGSNLYFEIEKEGSAINPLDYLN
ncbi:MAG: M23 family metallopeptidase [Lachnospiraceae bacterium]|nr:M23 family metallopeptidase [Lachnospiraceae bacterium]